MFLKRVLSFLLFWCLSTSDAVDNSKRAVDATIDAFWQWRMKEFPLFATGIGEHTYNDRVDSLTLASFNRRKVEVDSFLRDLKTVDPSLLAHKDRMNYDVLKDLLFNYVQGYSFKEYTYNAINFLEGPQKGHTSLLSLTPFKTANDFQTFLRRMSAIAKQIKETQGLLEEAVRVNKTMHAVSINRVPGQIQTVLSTRPKDYYLYIPFNETLEKLTNINSTFKTQLRSEAESIIQSEIYGAFRRLSEYITQSYLPKTRKGYGVSSLTGGKKYYEAALQWHISTTMTPDEVHELGRKEVERISTEMNKVMQSVKFTGTIKEFITYLKSQSRFFLKTEMDLLKEYRNIIFNRIKPTLPKVFYKEDIPNLPLLITSGDKNAPLAMYMRGAADGRIGSRLMINTHNPHTSVEQSESPDEPGGMYYEGSADGSIPGVFVANVFQPELRPTFDMLVLCLHEADPGHHMQISTMLLADLPKFRKYVDYRNYYAVPFQFLFGTAYTEGWALYAEYLGKELGLFTDPYELFGRYVSEMFRAARLVVDTGLHYKNWSRQKAIDYLAERLTDPLHQIEVEIDRYITWPGQACAYKIGEMQILEMRRKAELALGDKFNVKDFHKLMLQGGSLSLDILHAAVNDWIEKRTSSSQTIGLSSGILLVAVLLNVVLNHQ